MNVTFQFLPPPGKVRHRVRFQQDPVSPTPTMPISEPRFGSHLNDCPIVTISAHNLGGIMGHDRFNTRDQVLIDLWKRYNPGGHRRCMSGFDFDYDGLSRSLFSSTTPDARKRILGLFREVDTSNLDTDRIRQLYNYGATQRDPCLDILKRAIDRLRGIKLQDVSLDAALETKLIDGRKDGSEVWRSRICNFAELGTVCIGGYADMTLRDGRAVECKVRKSTNIMETAPARDLIQLAVYGDKGVLLERVGQSLVERELDSGNWWKMEAVPALHSFMKDLSALLTNTAPTSLIQRLRQDRRHESQWVYTPPEASSARIGDTRIVAEKPKTDGSSCLGGNQEAKVRVDASATAETTPGPPEEVGQEAE